MITIGIPCFNHEAYLADAIESALEQTQPCEVLVCDDGSTDHSLEIAKKYPVKVISQVNKGLASARNTLIMNMSGDYFLPLDADDMLLPDCVEKMEEVIKNEGCDVIAPSFKNFGLYNNEVILTGFPDLKNFMEYNYLPYFCAFKKEVLLEIGGYNPKMTWGYEDWDMHLDIFKRKHTVAVMQSVLVLYRTKESSMLTEAQKHDGALKDQMKLNHPELWLPS